VAEKRDRGVKPGEREGDLVQDRTESTPEEHRASEVRETLRTPDEDHDAERDACDVVRHRNGELSDS